MNDQPKSKQPPRVDLGELILQKGISFPDREYILNETHYRSAIPISPLSIINHFTFVHESFQDKFYTELRASLGKSLETEGTTQEPELRDVLERQYTTDGTPTTHEERVRLTEAIYKDFLRNEPKHDFIHALMFGAIDRIKIDIDRLILEAAPQHDEDKKCLQNLRRCFARNDNLYQIELVISRHATKTLAAIETPPASETEFSGTDAHSILRDIEAMAPRDKTEVYPNEDIDPKAVRRERYWVYRFRTEWIRHLDNYDTTVKPRVTLLSSRHAQHYNATFMVSFPEERDRDKEARAWRTSLFDDQSETWINKDKLFVENYLYPLATSQQFPGKRLSGSKYMFLPFELFLHRCVSLLLGPAVGYKAPIVVEAHHRAAVIEFLSTLARSMPERQLHADDVLSFLAAWRDEESAGPKGDDNRLLQNTLSALARMSTPVHRKRFQALIRRLLASPNGPAVMNEFVAQFAKPLFGRLFSQRTSSDDLTEGPELIVSRLASERAYFISDLVPQGRALLVLGIIIDLGLSSHQRGRLVQRLGDISTFRTLVLRDLGRVRAALEGLTYTALQLSVSQSDQVSALATALEVGNYASDIGALRTKLAKIRILQNRLLRYDLLITYGLEHKAISAATYHQLLEARLAVLKESKVGPHITMSGLLGRRLLGAEGNIERAAKRYSQLTTTIHEHLDAIRTVYQFAETDRATGGREEQTHLLKMAEVFGVIAGTYYLGNVILETLGRILAQHGINIADWVYRLSGLPLVLGSYLVIRQWYHRKARQKERSPALHKDSKTLDAMRPAAEVLLFNMPPPSPEVPPTNEGNRAA